MVRCLSSPWPGARASPWTLPQAPHGDRAAAQRALSRSPVAQRLAYRLLPPHLGRSACSPSVLAEAGLWWNCSGLLPALPCNDRCSPSGIVATYSETPREQSAAFFREVWSGLCHMHGHPYRRRERMSPPDWMLALHTACFPRAGAQKGQRLARQRSWLTLRACAAQLLARRRVLLRLLRPAMAQACPTGSSRLL